MSLDFSDAVLGWLPSSVSRIRHSQGDKECLVTVDMSPSLLATVKISSLRICSCSGVESVPTNMKVNAHSPIWLTASTVKRTLHSLVDELSSLSVPSFILEICEPPDQVHHNFHSASLDKADVLCITTLP